MIFGCVFVFFPLCRLFNSHLLALALHPLFDMSWSGWRAAFGMIVSCNSCVLEHETWILDGARCRTRDTNATPALARPFRTWWPSNEQSRRTRLISITKGANTESTAKQNIQTINQLWPMDSRRGLDKSQYGVEEWWWCPIYHNVVNHGVN